VPPLWQATWKANKTGQEKGIEPATGHGGAASKKIGGRDFCPLEQRLKS